MNKGRLDMRSTTILLLAASLGAAPAAAQNTTVEANTITANNIVAADPANMAGTAPVNGLAADPGAATTTGTTPPPVAGETGQRRGDRNHGFPWGLIGILGLVGLLGRRRRES